jgi:uncharacterized membrane protein
MRTVIAVIVGFVSMAVFTFALSIAPWYLFGVDTVLEQGRFETTPLITVYSVAIAFIGALLGGLIVKQIGRRMAGVVILAFLGLIVGTANAIGQINKPEPGARESDVTVMQAMSARKEPEWFTFLIPVVGVAGVLIGGRIGRPMKSDA